MYEYFVKSQLINNPSQSSLVIFKNGDIELTWHEFDELVDSAACFLKQCLIDESDVVVLKQTNSISYFIWLFAINRRNAVAALLDDKAGKETVDYLINKLAPKIIIENAAEVESKQYLISNSFLKAQKLTDFKKAKDCCNVIMFSSGSTGKPKTICLSTEHFIHTNINMEKWINVSRKSNHIHCELLLSPAVHMDGLQRVLFALKCGGTVVIYNELYTPKSLMKLIEKEKVTALYLPPSIVEFLAVSEEVFPSSVSHIEVGSAKHSEKTLKNLMQLISHGSIYVHYGLTECSRATMFKVNDHIQKLHTVGTAKNNLQVRVVDENFQDLPKNMTGQILLKGAQTINTYWNAEYPDKFYNGWYCTGDFGYVDNDQFLVFEGRHDDMMTRSGYHLYPSEIENQCVGMIGKSEIYFISEPSSSPGNDKLMGCLFASDKNFADPKTVFKILKASLPHHMIPNEIKVVTYVPRTSSGKIDRKKLKEIVKS